MDVKAAFVILHWRLIYTRRDLGAGKSVNYFFLRFRDSLKALVKHQTSV